MKKYTWLKTIKYQANLKTSHIYNLVSSLPPKIEILPILAKNWWKIYGISRVR